MVISKKKKQSHILHYNNTTNFSYKHIWCKHIIWCKRFTDAYSKQYIHIYASKHNNLFINLINLKLMLYKQKVT